MLKFFKSLLPVKVKKGQIWEYILKRGNPFEDSKTIQYEVLDVKDGWVKYKDVSDNLGIVRIDTINFFKIGSKCVKNDI